MSKYTINDVSHIIPVDQTATTITAVEKYLNEGVIPPYDPCQSCEPNHIRKLISLIQVAERNGLWPPARAEAKAKPKPRAKAKTPEPTEPQGEVAEDGYVDGTTTEDDLKAIQEGRAFLLGGKDDPEVDFTEVFKDK